MKVYILDKCCDISRSYIESMQMSNIFEKATPLEEADIICYVGCAYVYERIMEAHSDVFDIIARKKSSAKLGIFGCVTAYEPFREVFENNINVSYLGTGPGLKMQDDIADFLEESKATYDINNPELGINFKYPHRIDVVIEDGCNKRCAFCKSNYLNLHLRSIPLAYLYKTIEYFAKEYGVTEVNLTGLNVTSYGNDFKTSENLITLIRKISSINEIKTILLDSLNPDDITDELLREIISNYKIKRVMIPIQSMSDELLTKMGRKPQSARNRYILNIISQNRPDIFLETIFLITYPTETEDDVKKNIGLLESIRIHNPVLSVYCYGTNIPTLKSEKDFFMSENDYNKIGSIYVKKMLPIIESDRKELLAKPVLGTFCLQNEIFSLFSTYYRFTTNEMLIKCSDTGFNNGDERHFDVDFVEAMPNIVYRTYPRPVQGRIRKKR